MKGAAAGKKIRSPKPPYHHGDLRASLLDAALALIKAGGPEAVTLRKIAAQAKVSEAAPYHHFKNKDELLAFASAQGYSLLEARMLQAIASARPDPGSAFIAVALAYMEFGLDEPGRFRLLFGKHMQEIGLDPSVKAAGSSTVRLGLDLAAKWIEMAGIRMEPLKLFRLAWGQMHGLTWLVLEKEITVAGREEALALLEEGVTLLLRGAAEGGAS